VDDTAHVLTSDDWYGLLPRTYPIQPDGWSAEQTDTDSWSGRGVVDPIKIEESIPEAVKTLTQNRSDAPQHLVSELVVLLALAAQASAIENDGAGRLRRARRIATDTAVSTMTTPKRRRSPSFRSS